MLNNRRSIMRGISSGLILVGLALAFAFGGFNLPIFFVALAFSILIGGLSSSNPTNIFAGVQGFCWMLILSLFFITGSWIWFLVGAGISVFLGAMMRPILVAIAGMNILGMAPMPSSPSQYYQPAAPTYQPYKEGYQTPPSQPTYQEGEQHYPYPQNLQSPQQNAQPSVHHPQQMPPQQ